MQHEAVSFGPPARRAVGAGGRGRPALAGPKPCPSEPGERRATAGQAGSAGISAPGPRRGIAAGREFETGLAGSKAGQRELNEATRSARGQGPRWRWASRRARKPQRGDCYCGEAAPGSPSSSAFGRSAGSPGKAVSSGGCGIGTLPSGPRPRGIREWRGEPLDESETISVNKEQRVLSTRALVSVEHGLSTFL